MAFSARSQQGPMSFSHRKQVVVSRRGILCCPQAVLQRPRKETQQSQIPGQASPFSTPSTPSLSLPLLQPGHKQPKPQHQQPKPQHLEVAEHLNILYQRQILPNDVDQSSQLLASGSGESSMPEPATDGQYIYHFAYGANMNFYTLARRDAKVLSRDPAVVRDPEVRMLFKHRGGYATLQKLGPLERPLYPPFGAQRVHGVLYRLSMDEFKKLQKREGGYGLQEFEVETYSGRVVRAMVFVSSPLATLPQEVVPTEKYMALLREGARDNYLDPLYQAWISSVDTVTSVGLGPEYYNTPSKYVAYSFLFIVGCICTAFFFQH